MAVSALWYGLGLQAVVDGTENFVWSTDTIKVALCTSTYTPNQDTHKFFSSITNEVTGTGYTAGGATLGTKTTNYTTATNTVWLDAADTSWTTSTITARYAIVYKSTGTAGTSLLLGYVDFGADVVSTAGTFSIQWDALGILTVAAA
jgi:hypothetical protein